MIRITLSVLVFIYLFLFLAIVFSLWLWQGWRRQHTERRAVRFRLRCSMCGFEFEDASETLLPRCPRCGSLNERYTFRQL